MAFCCFYYPEEKDYIDKFIELYSNNILTPEGYIIYFRLEEINIVHFWRGGRRGCFNKQRAAKIQWIKEVLENNKIRSIKVNPKKKKEIYFICIEKNKKYVIRCAITSDNYFLCFTAYPINAKQFQLYSKWDNFT